MADYTFFFNPMSRAQIARWALHEVGADYSGVLVEWEAKPQALLDANPMGKLPTIIHHAAFGDRVVSEAAAVCHYLAEVEGRDLLPSDEERADYFRWLFFAAGPGETGITAKAMGFDTASDARKQISAGWGSYDRVVESFVAMLERRDFVCGARFTMADVYVGSHIDWGLAFGTLPSLPEFEAYAERFRARPAYRAAKAIDNALIAERQKQ